MDGGGSEIECGSMNTGRPGHPPTNDPVRRSNPVPTREGDPNGGNPEDSQSAGTKQLFHANVAFNTPTFAIRNRPITIQAILDVKKSADELRTLITEPGTTGTGTADVGTSVAALLSGNDVVITLAGPDTQAVRLDQPNRWFWTVVPTKSGILILNLVIVSNVLDSSTKAPICSDIFHRRITVQIRAMDEIRAFLSKNGMPIAQMIFGGGGIIGIISSTLKFINRYRKKSPEAHNP
jgi:hypothetical protein